MKGPEVKTEKSENPRKRKRKEMDLKLNSKVEENVILNKKRKKKKENSETLEKKSETDEVEIENKKNNLENCQEELDHEREDDIEYTNKEIKQFTGKAFRKALFNSDSALEALQKFIFLCKQESKRDIAKEYIEAKGSVLEILQVLDTSDKKNTNNASIVFSAMCILIVEIIKKHPDHIQLTKQACHHLINSHLSTIHSMLSSESKPRNRKIVLKLLAAIVNLGDPFPRQLLSHLSLHQEVVNCLVSQTRPTDPDNVRKCFINFILAFFIGSDELEEPVDIGVVRMLLEKRGVVSSIFSDLIYDHSVFVNFVLKTIKQHVLENPAISKTLKLHVFSTQVIQGIVNLYNWKGPKNWPGNKKQKSTIMAEVNQAEKEIVVSAVHEFLITLLTSNRFGVAFHDRKLGLDSGRKHNQLINTVLQKLEKPWEHEKPSELVVKILSACPDLIKSQLLLVEPFLVPRVSKKWIFLMEFLRKIIENVNEENCLKLCSTDMTTMQLSSAIQNLTLPQIILKNAVVPSLEHNSPIVHYEIIKLLLVMVKKVESFILSFEITKSNIANTFALKNNLLEQLSKNIPSFETILIIWKKALSLSLDQNSDPDEKDIYVNIKDRLLAILDLLQAYCRMCPEILLNNTTNTENQPKILLSSLDDIPNVTEEELTTMRVKALKILLCSDITSFAPSEIIFTSALSFLITKVGHEDVLFDLEIRQTIKLLLNSCGIFDGYNDQIEIWIDAITHIKNYEDKLEVANWVGKIIKRVSKNIDKYISLICQNEENVEEEIINTNKVDSIFDELIERSIEDMKSVMPMLPVTSISLLIYGTVESLKKPSSDAVAHYISIVLMHALHCQVYSKPLLSLVNDLKIPIKKYLTSWSNNSSPRVIKKPFNTENVFCHISKILLDFSGNYTIHVKESKLCIIWNENEVNYKLTNFELIALFRMVIFYLTHIPRKTQVQLSNISAFTNVLLSLLKIATESEVNSEDLTKECFKWIFKNPIILHYFQGIYQNKDSDEYKITNLFIQICEVNNKYLEYQFIQPYQEKFISQIKSTVKIHKDKNPKIEIEIFTELIKVLQLNVKNTVDLLNVVLSLKKEKFVNKSKLTVWGTLIPKLIDKLFIEKIKDVSDSSITMPNSLLKKLFFYLTELKILFKQDMSSWEDILYKYLVNFPDNISAIDARIFTRFFETNLTRTTEKILTLTCERNSKFITIFIKQIDSNESILQQKSLVFSILSNNLKYQWNREFLKKIYEMYKEDIVQYLTEVKVEDVSWIHENINAAIFLIENNFDSKSCEEISSIILSSGNKLDAAQEFHVKLYHCLFKKSTEANPDALKNFTQLLLHIIVIALKKDSKNVVKLNYLCKTFIDTINTLKSKETEFIFEKLSQNHMWPQFVRISLKSGLKPAKENKKNAQLLYLIKALSTACEVAYKNNDCEEYIKTIFSMVISHTEFQDVMKNNSNLKNDLVEFLWILVQKNKNTMSEKHIPMYLCAYNATLIKSDQFILKILRHFENNGIQFSDYSPFLWGKTAESHFNAEVSLDTALYRQRSISQIMDLLVPEKVSSTIKHFPVMRNLEGDVIDVENADEIYDPTFYLAVFCNLLKDSNDVPCHEVVHKGGLALIIIACSSTCDEIRSAAYTVLARFYLHLVQLGKSTKEKLLWIHFIEALRNGIAKLKKPLEKIRLNGFVATFLAQAAQVMTHPLHPLYSPIHSFLMAKPALDLDIIPEFLPLFHSSEIDHTAHRHWVLEVICSGFKNNEDMDIALKYMLFKMLLSFYNSSLSDNVTKSLILQTVRSATKLIRGCMILINGYSLLPWLLTTSTNLKKGDEDSKKCVNDIVNNIFDALQKTKSKEIHHELLLKKILSCIKSSL